MKPYLALIRRDLKLSVFRGSGSLVTLFFFVVTASLFPFALGGEKAALQKAAAGILWVAALLSALLSLENVYHRDEEDGTLDLMLMSPVSPMGIVLSKMLAHWLVAGLPLVLASVVVAQMLFVPGPAIGTVLLALLLGTFYMSLLGGGGAVLTFGARRPGLLLAVLVLPLYVPMLILGVMAAEAAAAGLPARAYLLLQLSLVLAALPVTSWAGAGFLRLHART